MNVVFIVGGEPVVGTLDDYAKAHEAAHKGGTPASGTVWVVDRRGGILVALAPTTELGEREADGITAPVAVKLEVWPGELTEAAYTVKLDPLPEPEPDVIELDQGDVAAAGAVLGGKP